MHSRLLSAALFLACLCASGLCDEPTKPTTAIRVYRVADLVARDTVYRSTLFGVCTMEEWHAEHKQTLAALERLSELLEKTVGGEDASIASHAESLSLVVRHTAEGHREIAELLEQLREEEEPCVELTFLVVPNPETHDVAPVGAHVASAEPCGDGVQRPSWPSAQAERPRERLAELCRKGVLTPDESAEVRQISAESIEPALAGHTDRVANGRKAVCLSRVLPLRATATVLVSRDRSHVRLRLDNVTDDVHDKVPFAAQCFSIPDGHAALVLIACDGGITYWLVTPRVIDPKGESQLRGATSGKR